MESKEFETFEDTVTVKTEPSPLSYPVKIFKNRANSTRKQLHLDPSRGFDILCEDKGLLDGDSAVNQTTSGATAVTGLRTGDLGEAQAVGKADCFSELGSPSAACAGGARKWKVTDRQLLGKIVDHLGYVKTAHWGINACQNEREKSSSSKLNRELESERFHFYAVPLDSETRNSMPSAEETPSGNPSTCIDSPSTIRVYREPYICGLCEKAFYSEPSIFKHWQRVHSVGEIVAKKTGKRAYTCLQCGQVLANLKGVVVGQNTETGEQTYTCHICRKIQRSAKTEFIWVTPPESNEETS